MRQRGRGDLPGLSRPGAAHALGRGRSQPCAFERAYTILRARIEAFLALPLDELAQERARFKGELDKIGTLLP